MWCTDPHNLTPKFWYRMRALLPPQWGSSPTRHWDAAVKWRAPSEAGCARLHQSARWCLTPDQTSRRRWLFWQDRHQTCWHKARHRCHPCCSSRHILKVIPITWHNLRMPVINGHSTRSQQVDCIQNVSNLPGQDSHGASLASSPSHHKLRIQATTFLAFCHQITCVQEQQSLALSTSLAKALQPLASLPPARHSHIECHNPCSKVDSGYIQVGLLCDAGLWTCLKLVVNTELYWQRSRNNGSTVSILARTLYILWVEIAYLCGIVAKSECSLWISVACSRKQGS